MSIQSPHTLVIGLPKGRIFAKAVTLLDCAGISLNEDAEKSRKLLLATNKENIFITVLRNSDSPVYTELAAVDLAIIGQDTIAELPGKRDFYDVLDLGIARCSLMTAARKGYERQGHRVRVATKFVHSARRYYSSLGIQADVIKLYGSVELAVVIDLADEIVDLVETGRTLAENSLESMEKIMDVTSHLVVNCNSMVTKHKAIIRFVSELEGALVS